jgi:hypothetical protein
MGEYNLYLISIYNTCMNLFPFERIKPGEKKENEFVRFYDDDSNGVYGGGA